MTTLIKILGVVFVIGAVLFLTMCTNVFRSSYQWNYKITMTVETREGVVSASNVIEARAVPATSLTRPARYAFPFRGEATALELTPAPDGGEARWLFLILSAHSDGATLPASVFASELKAMGANAIHINPYARYDWVPLMRRLEKNRPKEIPRKFLPRLVTFQDINVPASVREVDPDDLAARFGPGYVLKSITLELTDDVVTLGQVEQVLGWLRENWPHTLDGRRFHSIHAENRVANSLTSNSFSTEIKK